MTGYAFIIAQPRSGSTLVMHFANLLDGVLMRGENGAILMRSWVQHDRVRKILALHGRARTFETDPFFGVEDINLPALDDALRAMFTDLVLRPEGGERFIGCKEVRHSTSAGPLSDEEDFVAYCDWLLTWPDARLIFLVRDPHVAARSGFLKERPFDDVVADLTEQERRFWAMHQRYPSRTRFIRYEDFCARPEVAQQIADLLDAGYADAAYRAAMSVQLRHA